MTSAHRHLASLFIGSAVLVSGLSMANGKDLMIVLDGSGSMWGQIDGVTKIEIARDTLSSVLGEASVDMNIGMMAYGHRVRGQCSDIEMMVPLAPAAQTVPQIIVAANGLNPIGMTPLSDSVRMAADYLRYTERAATVVLVTDGIETCEADPCALGNELARAGLDFTAHVVGFGMSEEEGAQVACLAENTGGAFFLANDPEALADALSRTIGTDDDFLPEEEQEPEMAASRNVHIILREVDGGTPLFSNVLTGQLQALDPALAVPEPVVAQQFTGTPYSVSVDLEPGQYEFAFQVKNSYSDPAYRDAIAFEVTQGGETLVIDRVVGGRLKLIPFVSAGHAYARDTNAISPDLYVTFTPVRDGQLIVEEAIVNANVGRALSDGVFEERFAPGTWLVSGQLFRTFTREKLVDIAAGGVTEMVFDFEAAPVLIDIVDEAGVSVPRPSLYLYDNPGESWWKSGGTRTSDGTLVPAYLPVGTWYFDIGASGGGALRAQGVVDVSTPGEAVSVTVRTSERVDDDALGYMLSPAYSGCLEPALGNPPCVVETVEFP